MSDRKRCPPRSAAATGAGERLSSRWQASEIQQKAPASEGSRYTEMVRANESYGLQLLFGSEGAHGIYGRGTPRWHNTGNHCNQEQ
jgi:hypothetical protein